MGNSRRFSGSERVALYLAAGGRCCKCGRELEPGWHADHVYPWIAGGPTSVSNGQALCDTCNLRKGSKMASRIVTSGISRRPWQERLASSIDEKIEFLSGRDCFPTEQKVVTIHAFCGSGKTLGLLDAANTIHQRELATHVLILTPRLNLCRAYEKAWRDVRSLYRGDGMGVVAHRGNDPPLLVYDLLEGPQHGVATTYQSLVKRPDLYRDFCRNHRTVLVVDESQQLGTSNGMDENDPRSTEIICELASLCKIVLSATGTPIRSDKKEILWGRYIQAKDRKPGIMVLDADVEATYKEGVHNKYLKKIDLIYAHKGEVWKRFAGKLEEDMFLIEDLKSGLKDVYKHPDIWMPIVDRGVDTIAGVRRQRHPNFKSIFRARTKTTPEKSWLISIQNTADSAGLWRSVAKAARSKFWRISRQIIMPAW